MAIRIKKTLKKHSWKPREIWGQDFRLKGQFSADECLPVDFSHLENSGMWATETKAWRQVQIREGMFPVDNLEGSYTEVHRWPSVKRMKRRIGRELRERHNCHSSGYLYSYVKFCTCQDYMDNEIRELCLKISNMHLLCWK